jgi:cell wall-associated NlpC family hydrolase
MLGVPFLHLGRDRNGIDCVGLLAYAREYPARKLPAYPRDPLRGELEQQLDAILGPPVATSTGADTEQLRAALLPGDVVAMAYAGPIRHVGLVAQHPSYPEALSLIHTDSRLGYVTEHILDAKWLRRIRRVYRT